MKIYQLQKLFGIKLDVRRIMNGDLRVMGNRHSQYMLNLLGWSVPSRI